MAIGRMLLVAALALAGLGVGFGAIAQESTAGPEPTSAPAETSCAAPATSAAERLASAASEGTVAAPEQSAAPPEASSAVPEGTPSADAEPVVIPKDGREAFLVAVTAVRGTKENRREKAVDTPLQALAPVLNTLDNCDTFSELSHNAFTAGVGAEAQAILTDRYTLYVTPLIREDDGRIRIRVRIEEYAGTGAERRSRTAVRTVLSVVPGGRLIMGGLKLPDGAQLIALLSVQ